MNILKKKMTLTAFVFPKLQTPRTWLDNCLKSHVSEDPSTSNMVNVPKHCWNLHHRQISIFIDHCQNQLSWKKSLLLTCKILGLLVNTLATDEKYPVLNRENLTIPIQMQLSQKQKTFSEFFAAFLKFRVNFEYFEKKDDPHRFFIFEVTDSENVVK